MPMGIAEAEIDSAIGHVESKLQAPVAELFGFSSSIRSATAGRALWSTENSGFEKVPRDIQTKVVSQIRTRKGLKPEPYDEKYYSA